MDLHRSGMKESVAYTVFIICYFVIQLTVTSVFRFNKYTKFCILAGGLNEQ